MLENDYQWVHRNYICLLIKNSIELHLPTKNFSMFNHPPPPSWQIQSSKCRYNSNETLLKTNESIERTYESNHISVPLELNPFFVVPHFNGKFIVFWLQFCFQGPALIFRMGWVCAFSCWHHNYKTVSKRDNNISPWGQYQGYKDMDDQRPVEIKR